MEFFSYFLFLLRKDCDLYFFFPPPPQQKTKDAVNVHTPPGGRGGVVGQLSATSPRGRAQAAPRGGGCPRCPRLPHQTVWNAFQQPNLSNSHTKLMSRTSHSSTANHEKIAHGTAKFGRLRQVPSLQMHKFGIDEIPKATLPEQQL